MAKTINTQNVTQGYVDEKGFWNPSYPCTDSPLFYWPPQPKKIIKYLLGFPGYLWPKLVLYILLSVGTVALLEKDLSNPDVLTLPFIGLMLLRNLGLIWFVFGGYHLFLYIFKVQGKTNKYSPNWMAKNSKRFLFKDQVLDNIFRSCVSGATIWTAYEVVYVWAVANKFIRIVDWKVHPVYCVILLLLVPILRETHFYFVHRMLHSGYLMRKVHSIHHKNADVGPWSGLAMHPLEHLLYFSSSLIHVIIPSNPIHFFLNIQFAGLAPAAGHIGFEGPLYGGKYPSGDYFHYLHHRYVSCNFGSAGLPWDRWFGYFYNGQGKFVNRLNKRKKV